MELQHFYPMVVAVRIHFIVHGNYRRFLVVYTSLLMNIEEVKGELWVSYIFVHLVKRHHLII